MQAKQTIESISGVISLHSWNLNYIHTVI